MLHDCSSVYLILYILVFSQVYNLYIDHNLSQCNVKTYQRTSIQLTVLPPALPQSKRTL